MKRKLILAAAGGTFTGAMTIAPYCSWNIIARFTDLEPMPLAHAAWVVTVTIARVLMINGK